MAAFIFDDDCAFCKKWVGWLKAQTGNAVDYTSYQARPQKFRNLKDADLQEASHFVDENNAAVKGAPAFFKAMELRPQGTRLMGLYERVKPFRWAADAVYEFVAGHRTLAAWLTWFFIGEEVVPARYEKVRSLFLKFLALSYFSAFVSLAVQVKGLLGPHGILPAESVLNVVRENLGSSAHFSLPTLAWLSSGSLALQIFCASGALASCALFFGFCPGLSALVCWVLYSSLVNIGGVFLSFQWDALLLEAGFLAIFFAPWRLRVGYKKVPAASFAFVILYRWLLFRLMFSSGVVKWISGDPAWRNFTALQYHFQTQPLPNPLAWYAHHLPAPVLTAATGAMFFIEWFVPFAFLLPRRFRLSAFWFQNALQIMILVTGNYAYFNLLTIGLSFFLLDDAALDSWSRFTKPKKLSWVPASRSNLRLLTIGLTSLILILAGVEHIKSFFSQDGLFDQVAAPVTQTLERYHVMSGYGLFAVMTTTRNEIVIEGSDDQNQWLPYEFKYKPGDVSRAPPLVAPHQPRIDWQAWFAAFGEFQNESWLQNLAVRLLQGEPDVEALFAKVPFSGHPPKFIRLMLYEYRFSNADERGSTGAWWMRTLKGAYSPVMSLKL